MNRTDRLLGLLIELQSRNTVSAQELARRFETSKRTIYRDIQALSETGVPVVSRPGQGYSIVDGYFLPPVGFTKEEATMLVLGANFMAESFEAPYNAAARNARSKIEAVLAPSTREEVRTFRERICLMPPTAPLGNSSLAFLPQLRTAVLERRRVRLLYHTRYTGERAGEKKHRDVDPYALYYSGVWYLTGHCHLRHDIRSFRVERIRDARLLDQVFERPRDLRLGTGDSLDERTYVARVQFDKDVAPWVRESMSYYATDVRDSEGSLIVTLRARLESEILHWILSWGAGAKVLEPASLRERIRSEAKQMIE